ncbi:Beta-lactamase class A [Caldanaerobius fijiensis DSM 17918]|uniref:Beta-lactamase class A n=1 Tax=Caldanaerobius fijiensis DSM 17918 TaxID=1121256 RepID=A0A1M5F2E1_9THEO|nr:serine hydrolase [Caldanaerobius fijiensis]SHF85627.1 Beta-lactamase class A [Caldanaerobius fijiensis DSM 17918]
MLLHNRVLLSITITIICILVAFFIIRIPANTNNAITSVKIETQTEQTYKISKPDYEPLKQKIAEYISANKLSAGIYFKDITTNTTFGINEDKMFVAASTIKVPIMLYLYTLAAEKKVDLNTKIAYDREKDFESGAGILEYIAKQGDKYSLRTLANQAITTSDNIANRMIMRYLGKENIIKFMKDLGGQTVYPGGKNITTAKDLVTYMEAVIAFSKANPELGETFLNDMAHTVYNAGIPALLPDKLFIPHKEGDLDDVANDFGIVYCQRPYILAILTNKNKNADTGFKHIANISKIIYDYQVNTGLNASNSGIKYVFNPITPDNQDISNIIAPELKNLFDIKAKALMGSDGKKLKDFFDLSSTYGKYAYEHELRRIHYVTSWSKNRNIRFTDIYTDFRIIFSERKSDSIWIYAVETMNARYDYNDDAENFFGIGIRHAIQMVQKGEKWLIKKDWYTDPLDEDTVVQDVTPASGLYIESDVLPKILKTNDNIKAKGYIYNREKAVKYADLYNGGAYLTEKKHRYNQKYPDYTGIGGDCTNFVSQCLGDPEEGGGLPQDYIWFFDGKAGSKAWVQADSLANYLLYSGKGSLIARGRFNEVQNHLKSLMPGDLIAYEEKNDVVHFAIITGFNSKSIPVVNSHTSDRYHVPWDLGWDKNTVFWLIHING